MKRGIYEMIVSHFHFFATAVIDSPTKKCNFVEWLIPLGASIY